MFRKFRRFQFILYPAGVVPGWDSLFVKVFFKHNPNVTISTLHSDFSDVVKPHCHVLLSFSDSVPETLVFSCLCTILPRRCFCGLKGVV